MAMTNSSPSSNGWETNFVADLDIRFDIKPFPKERPRATRTGVIYTPRKTKDYEQYLVALFQDQFPDHIPFEEPLDIKVDIATDHIVVAITKVDHKPQGMRGDLDNYVKAAMDALNNVAFVDDNQIVSITARKVGQ